jgi:hypothetical protein
MAKRWKYIRNVLALVGYTNIDKIEIESIDNDGTLHIIDDSTSKKIIENNGSYEFEQLQQPVDEFLAQYNVMLIRVNSQKSDADRLKSIADNLYVSVGNNIQDISDCISDYGAAGGSYDNLRNMLVSSVLDFLQSDDVILLSWSEIALNNMTNLLQQTQNLITGCQTKINELSDLLFSLTS